MSHYFFRRYLHAAWLIVLGLCLLFVDFVTKAYIYDVLPFYDSCKGLRCYSISVFQNFLGIDFSISLAFNKGAAWGIFSDFQFILLFVRVVAILGMFLYLFFVNQNQGANIPLIFIISGAIGNVIDFFLYGFVIDFLQFNLWGYHFPVFNLADTWITIGVFWLFLVAFFNKKKRYASSL